METSQSALLLGWDFSSGSDLFWDVERPIRCDRSTPIPETTVSYVDRGSPSRQGVDCINGHTFLERFYSVLSPGNRRVGLAAMQFTTATSNRTNRW
ncbi:hypothetical protein BJV77DRAFT_1067997 [Russula vinacea]|nr:hypothetical protein BJV77DRAFT_1067997 [Russula vinacea]